MHKTTVRSKHNSNYDLYNDLANIKAALADVTRDVKGRAGEILSQSFEDIKDKTYDVHNNVSGYVSKKPIKSVGIVLLIGLLLGYIIHK